MTTMNALTVWTGKTTEAAAARARADRTAAEQRIADLQAKRAAELGGECGLSEIDLLDVSIEAERRTMAIAGQRIAVIERSLRREAAARREARRDVAIKTIAKRLAKRTALAVELETAIARVVAIAEEIKDERPIKKAWPFPEVLPQWFDWRFHDLGKQIMYSLRRTGGDIMPDDMKQAIGWPDSGDGIARALPAGPRLPNDLPSVLSRNADHILDSLHKLEINPPDDDASTEAVA